MSSSVSFIRILTVFRVQVFCLLQFSSLNCVRPHGLQHARLPCPSPTPRARSNLYVHQVSDAIWSSHPLSSLSPPAFSLSQHQGLFQWVSSSHQVAKVLDFQLQHQSLEYSGMNIQDSFPLGWTGDHSLQSKGLSIVFYNTTVQKHQFFSTQLSLWSNSHIHTWLLEKPYLWLDKHLLA